MTRRASAVSPKRCADLYQPTPGVRQTRSMLRALALLTLAAAPLATTVKEMSAAYAENEVAADARFQAPLVVAGKVFAIGRDTNGEPYVTLFDGTRSDWLVRCFPDSPAGMAKLKTGQRAKLSGTGTGIRRMGNFTVADLKTCDVAP